MVPSITETLFYLGLGDSVVGRTKFCVHPQPNISQVEKIGGTKNVNVQKVKSLNPDLVIANKEENVKEDVEEISKFCKTYVSEIKDWKSSLKMIDDLGRLCDVKVESYKLINELERIKEDYNFENRGRVLYLIWKDPYMSIGGDTFIHNMLELAGYLNVCEKDLRYPIVELSEFKGKVDYVFLSSEPFPFKEKHIEEIESAIGAPCVLVDGELFSWYGNRMINAFDYFASLPTLINKSI